MIFIIGAVCIMLIAALNYKKGFLLYLLFQMIWFPDTQMFSVGGLSVNLNLLVAVYFLGLYFCKKRLKYPKCKAKFPYYESMLCIAFSMIATCITSLSGFLSEFVKACGLIIMDLIIIYLIWKIVETKKEFIFLFKGITAIALFACLYMFYEYLLKSNPILYYKLSCTSNKLYTYMDFNQYDLRGYRCYSVFEHPICASLVLSLYVVLVLYLIINNIGLPWKYVSIIAMALCIPCILMTKQRSGIFFLLVACLGIIKPKRKKFWMFVIVSVLFLIMLSPFLVNYMDYIFSLFSARAQQSISGSNALMRFSQLNAVFHIMQMSPIAGLGENFKQFYSSSYAAQALDFESLWFEQMAKHGIFGVVSYIIMIYYSVYKIPKKYCSKNVFYISFAYWLTYSLTSTPYFRTYFLYVVIFYFIKTSKGYIEKYNTVFELKK